MFELIEPMACLHDDCNVGALPKKLYIEPTSNCNLNCKICFRRGWVGEPRGNMRHEVFENTLRGARELGSLAEILFGGMGEPLFHPDILPMVTAAAQITRVTMVTNGTLLTAPTAEALVCAGIDTLWVSVDGFDKGTPEHIQQSKRFDLILENLRAYNAARRGSAAKLGLTFVASGENFDQLTNIDDFADKFSADSLNISLAIPNAPISREAALLERDDIPTGKMRRFQDGAPAHEKYTCPFVSGNGMFVRWDGDIAPCMQLLHNCTTFLYEEPRCIHRAVFGNVETTLLGDAWNSKDYTAFRHRVNTFYFPFCDICWGCEDRKENIKDCFLSLAPTCGACLWASGKVFCP